MRFTRWDQVFSEKDTDETVSKLVTWHLAEIKDASVRESILCVSGSGALAICKFNLDYSSMDANDAYHARQVLAFFSKRRDLVLEGVDKRAVALARFRESEQKCLETNMLFRLLASGGFFLPLDVEPIFYRARRIIASILGDVPTLESLSLGFGPGATTQTKRKISSARSKLGQKFCCSEDMVPVVSLILEQMPSWLPESFVSKLSDRSEIALVDVTVDPCRLSFVPKTALTDRGICTEPSLNVMFQRGVGKYMSDRLKLFGVDLLDQSLNKDLAREGSITGALATLDLSSASDLIATEVVFNLVPIDWYCFLSYGRSSLCQVEGEVVKLQKFSSMGNGFTFPLESLIFYALAKACCEEGDTVSVYGDDIIVPTGKCALVMRVLEIAGFAINHDKSCTSGPFRESCGGDYLSGIDIRPFYLRDRLSGQYAFMLHNFYVRRGMLEAAQTVLESIDISLRIYGPDGYGDGHLLGDCQLTPAFRERGWGGFLFDTFTFKPKRDFTPYSGDHVLPCYSIYAEGPHFGLGISRFLDPYGERPCSYPSYRAQSSFYRKSVLGVTIPGTRGYKRISVYVLAAR